MRSTVATVAVGVVLAALVVAAVIGVVRQLLPDELVVLLVEVREASDGRLLVEVRDGPDEVLADSLDAETALVDALQVACLGGSLADVPDGAHVTITGVGEVRDGAPPTILADRAVIDCA